MQNHFIFLIENVVINVFGSGPAIMDFKVEEPWNNEKYCRPPWLAERKNFWILDALEWPKQKHFDPNKNPLTVSALKLFLSFTSLLYFCYAKKWGGRDMYVANPVDANKGHLTKWCYSQIFKFLITSVL